LKDILEQNGRAQRSVQEKMVYSYFTLRCLQSCIKRDNLLFSRVLVYEDLKLQMNGKSRRETKKMTTTN